MTTAQTWSTSSALISDIKHNRPDAWERFVKLYTPLVYCWGRNRGLNPQDSHDLVQDVFRLVFQAIPRFEPESFRGWLWTITLNQIRLKHRRRDAADEPVGGSAALVELHQHPETADSESESLSVEKSRVFLLNQALGLIRGDFSETTWNAFWKTVLDGQNSTEVAEELGISPSTVRNAKLRVLHRLREELGRL